MDDPVESESRIAIVVIGRNEGDRLKRCLYSLPRNACKVYVDSGSIDESVAFAQSLGIDVIELDTAIPFTAARARNVGWRWIAANAELQFVQFLDGDCELSAEWLNRATASLVNDQELAAVFGRRRERYPESSIYNRMCDDEWDVPIGLAESCGGDVLFRLAALEAANGYSDSLIAGEEPDLCLRLRQIGWKIRRIDAEMTLHDAAMTSFSQYWARTKRSGFAYAEHVWRHRGNAIPSWRRQMLGIVFWGLLIPATAMLSLLLYVLTGKALALFACTLCLGAYPVQVARVAARKAATIADAKFAGEYAALIVAGKIAQGLGAVKCWTAHMLHSRAELIEYKRA